MKIKVPQKELICNLKYVRMCDYVYSFTDWLDNGKHCKIIVNYEIINDLINDNRLCVSIYCKSDYLQELFIKIKNINKKIILILGCSDISITDIYNRYIL